MYVCMYVMTKCSNVKHVYMNKSPVLNKVAVNLVVMAMSDEGEVWLWSYIEESEPAALNKNWLHM